MNFEQYMKTFLTVFTLACLALSLKADSANIVFYQAQSAVGYLNQFLNISAAAAGNIYSTIIPDQLWQQDSSLSIVDISCVDFRVLTPPTGSQVNSSNTSIVISTGATFSASVMFSFAINGSITTTGAGTGILTGVSDYSLYFGSTAGGQPQHVLNELNITWGTFVVTTSYSHNTSDPVNLNISQSLTANMSTLLNSSIINILTTAANNAYGAQDSAWSSVMSYEYTLRRSFNWNNSYYLSNLNATDMSTTVTINGSIEATGYTNTSDTSTVNINKAGKPNQIAYSLQGFQNFVQFAFDNQYFSWNFDKDVFPLSTFDYTINDLSNFAPSMAAQAPANSFVEFTCVPVNPLKLSFNSTTNWLNTEVDVNCGVNIVGASTFILNITFSANLGIAPSVESTGTLNFVVASGSYVSGTAAAFGLELSARQLTILEFYIQGAVGSLPGTYCMFGSGILLPWTTLVNSDYAFDSNWLYISSD